MKKLWLRIIAICFLAAFLAAPAAASDWQPENTSAELAWVMFHIADWSMTLDLVDKRYYTEMNPLLGPHPTRGEVNEYMAAILVLHPTISYLLPQKTSLYGVEYHPRAAWQYISLGAKATAVGVNLSIGLRMGF